MFNSQFQKIPSVIRTKKVQADCTNWFPWSKWLHSTASCKVKNQGKKNTKTTCLSCKSWFMEATCQVSCYSATFQAYQENPAAVLPDDFLLVRQISMCACDCDGTLERQKNIAPGNVAEWILQWKKQQGDRWNENRENAKKWQQLSTFLWRSAHHGAGATL